MQILEIWKVRADFGNVEGTSRFRKLETFHSQDLGGSKKVLADFGSLRNSIADLRSSGEVRAGLEA